MDFDFNTSYMLFVLGYDLLHDYFEDTECDIAFEECIEIYEGFLVSEYNRDYMSEYECLAEYVNAEIIRS